LGEEATVAIAKDEGSAGVEDTGKEVEAAALEEGAEGEVLEPAVGVGDPVEVRWHSWIAPKDGGAFRFGTGAGSNCAPMCGAGEQKERGNEGQVGGGPAVDGREMAGVPVEKKERCAGGGAGRRKLPRKVVIEEGEQEGYEDGGGGDSEEVAKGEAGDGVWG